ncbi:MAG: mechanosensitive ion channel family protein [Myxococcaceae bacterium]|nr:mechanosensitive ion channel family protein [Myxococcaceae bacterium]
MDATSPSSELPPFLARFLPSFLVDRSLFGIEAWQWLALVLVIVVAIALGVLVERGLLGVFGRAARLTKVTWDDKVVGAAHRTLRFVALAALLGAGTRWILLPHGAQHLADIACTWLVIYGVARFLLRLYAIVGDSVVQAATDNGAPPPRLRGLRTQVTVLRRVAEVATVVVAFALALIQFDLVRSVGVSLLASAGIAGLVIGLAAQKTLSNLLAGIQISITQPVRIGDVVVIENEWGWIEEITLSYVVVKVWDLRRLVIPINQLLEKPFQNWSRLGTELLGTVEVRADYTVDVEAVRAELRRILENEGQSLWDGRAQGVQMTDAGDRVVVVRALVSAADSGKLWDLRCLVREKLVAFLARNPRWLPVNRNQTRVQETDEVKGFVPP